MNEPTSDAPPSLDVRPEPAEPNAAFPGTSICPFLVSAAGPWRSAEPARDHCCSMAAHSSRLDLDHQRRYCVGSGGPGCSRYVAPRAPGRHVSTLPVVVERGPFGAALERDGLRRFAGPASVVVVGAALGAFLLARGPGAPAPGSGIGGAGSAGALSTPPDATPSRLPVSAAPSQVPASTPPQPTPAPVASVSPAPLASPPPANGRTYTVVKGDTLGAIANRFATTTTVLAHLNAIANPSFIRVGQVLQLP
jgi:hypothetical protein